MKVLTVYDFKTTISLNAFLELCCLLKFMKTVTNGIYVK